MSEKSKKILLKSYGILTSVSVIAVGILFAYNCVTIYKSGPSAFNRQIINDRFMEMFFPVITSLILIFSGIVLDLIFASNASNPPALSSEKIKLLNENARQRAQKDTNTNPTVFIKLIDICSVALLALCLVFTVIYLAFIADFTVENLNNDVIKHLLFLAPSVCFVFIFRAIAAVVKNKRIRISVFTQKITCSKTVLVSVRTAALILAFVLIIAGILNGGADDVFQKAVKICTECIGLG